MTSVVVTQTTINASVVQESVSVSVTSSPINVTISPVDINSHSAVTIGTANGLSLSGQVLSLGLSSALTTGALSNTDWSTFNNKQNALGYTPVNIASVDWIDLTDGGATTLHSHAGGISGSGVVGQLAEWVTNTTTLQAAKLIGPASNILTITNSAAATLALAITSAKTLTLTAADNYNLTVPATGTAALGTGTATQLAYWSTTNTLTGSSSVLWNQTTKRFSINGAVAVAFAVTANSTDDGLYGRADDSGAIAVQGYSVSGRAGFFNSGSTTRESFGAQKFDQTNSAVSEALRITVLANGAGAAGFGGSLNYYAETATDGTSQLQGRIATSWIDATNATRKAKMSLSAYDTAARLGIEIEADGSVAKIGLFGVITQVATSTDHTDDVHNLFQTTVTISSQFSNGETAIYDFVGSVNNSAEVFTRTMIGGRFLSQQVTGATQNYGGVIAGGQFKAQTGSSTSVSLNTGIGGDFYVTSLSNRASWVSTKAIGGRFGIDLQSNTTHTTTAAYSLYATTHVKNANITITTSYGLYVEAMTVAATNYAIYTNAGLVHFGDSLDLASGKNITLIAGNIATDTSTGTKIGTATTQKLGFWNVNPVIQPAAANQAALTNSTTGAYDGTLVDVGIVFSQAAINDNFTDIYTLLTEIRTALVNTGIMKGAA